MNIDELKLHVRAVLSSALPSLTIKIEQLADQTGDLGVSVFGVEKNMVKWVREIILDLDTELCSQTDFALTPLVRDIETTRKYYPQFLSAWTSQIDRGQCGQAEAVVSSQTDILVDLEEIDQTAWVLSSTVDFCASAAQEELALAA